MSLKINWANKHSMIDDQSPMRTSSDVPVVRLDELARWLEARHLELEHELIAEVLAGNTYKEAMARHAMAEVDMLMAELATLRQA